MYSLKCTAFFNKRTCTSAVKKNRQTLHTHPLDNDFLRGRAADLTINTIESMIIFSFSLVKITCKRTTSKKTHLKVFARVNPGKIIISAGFLDCNVVC